MPADGAAGHRRGSRAVFAVVTAGIAMVNLDLFIVNVALPSIGRTFGGANLASLSWVLNAYAIVFAALLVPAGRAADLIGRRTAFLAGVIVFALASAACAVAPDVWLLVVARIVQAAGGALLMPASLGLLLAAAPPDKRTGAIRGWTSVGGAAAALGPVLGGALVAANWRWVFLVNVPIAAVALVASLRVLPRADNSKKRASADDQPGDGSARTPWAPRCSRSRSARSPWPWSSPTTGAGRRPGYWARSRRPRSWSCCSSAGPPGTPRRSSSRTCSGSRRSRRRPRRTSCSAPRSARCC